MKLIELDSWNYKDTLGECFCCNEKDGRFIQNSRPGLESYFLLCESCVKKALKLMGDKKC